MKPGTEVVCVNDSIKPEQVDWQVKHCPNWVKKGQKYTIRHFDTHDDIVDGVLLVEVVNKPVYCVPFNVFLEPRFATCRFRELEKPDPTREEIETEAYVTQ